MVDEHSGILEYAIDDAPRRCSRCFRTGVLRRAPGGCMLLAASSSGWSAKDGWMALRTLVRSCEAMFLLCVRVLLPVRVPARVQVYIAGRGC